jgi:hypothetical protein
LLLNDERFDIIPDYLLETADWSIAKSGQTETACGLNTKHSRGTARARASKETMTRILLASPVFATEPRQQQPFQIQSRPRSALNRLDMAQNWKIVQCDNQ